MSFRRALLPLIAVFAAAFAVPAKSASPEGLWLVEDQAGRIRIEKCGNEMWGFLAWQKEARNDTNNPDPAWHEAGRRRPLGRQRLQPARRQDLQFENSDAAIGQA